MKIMSYNIHSGKSMDNVLDIPAIENVICGENPDICALNEVRMRTTDVGGLELAKVLGEAAGMEWRFGRTIDINGGEYGNGMLSRYPILESRVVPVPEVPVNERVRHYEPRAALECVLDTPAGKIRVVTCHFGLSDAEQQNAVETVLSMFKDDMPFVLMGDFNIKPDNPIIARLRAVLQDTGTDLPLTFNAREPFEKIDYIFLSRDFRAGAMETRTTLASDHLPVVVEARLG